MNPDYKTKMAVLSAMAYCGWETDNSDQIVIYTGYRWKNYPDSATYTDELDIEPCND